MGTFVAGAAAALDIAVVVNPAVVVDNVAAVDIAVAASADTTVTD